MGDLVLCDHCGEKVPNPCESERSALTCIRMVGIAHGTHTGGPDEPDVDDAYYADDRPY